MAILDSKECDLHSLMQASGNFQCCSTYSVATLKNRQQPEENVVTNKPYQSLAKMREYKGGSLSN